MVLHAILNVKFLLWTKLLDEGKGSREGRSKMLTEVAEKDLLDANDLTIFFNVDEHTIQRWRNKRLIKYINICGSIIISYRTMLCRW